MTVGRIGARRSIACAAGIVAAALLALAWSGTASAHASLTSTDPADGSVLARAPATVTLRFDEAVTLPGSGTEVLSPAGRTVSTSVHHSGELVTIAVPQGTDRGTYTVAWRVVSADSHVISGGFTYSVGVPSTPAAAPRLSTSDPVRVLAAVARGLGYLGFALLAGGVALCCYAPAGSMRIGRTLRLLVPAWCALALGTAGVLLLQGPLVSGASLGAVTHTSLLRQTLQTTYGVAGTVRLLLAGTAPALIGVLLAQRPDALRVPARRTAEVAAAAVAAAIAATWAVGGHASTSSQPIGTMAADSAHLVAGALWLGGLAAYVIGHRPGDAGLPAARRFSRVAVISVLVLVGTGVYQAWLRVELPQAILTTDYGRLLLAKVAGLAAILLIAAASRKALHCRVFGRGEASTVEHRLPRLMAAETLGAVGVIGVAAVLVANQPAGQAYADSALHERRSVTLNGAPAGTTARVDLDLPHRRRGATEATVRLSSGGRPLTVPELQVAWSLGGRGIGPVAARVTRAGPGAYAVRFAPLPVTGEWTATVTIRTTAIDETITTLGVRLR